jgi:heme A synthase
MLSWRLYQALLFILPLPFAGVPDWSWGIFSALAFASLGAHLYHYISSVKRQPNVPTSFKKSLPVMAALIMVQLIVLFQYLLPWLFTASAPHENYLVLIKGFSLVTFFALTVLHLNSRSRTQRAIWLVVIAATFQAMYGSVMVMTGLEWSFFSEKWAYLGKATGTFVNRNHLAGYLEMSLALGIGYLLASSTAYSGNWQQKLRQLIEVLLSPKGYGHWLSNDPITHG